VRVDPFDAHDYAGEEHGAVWVKFGSERVMGSSRDCHGGC
jgi:hypothetical protein